jgi:hypothetical protein
VLVGAHPCRQAKWAQERHQWSRAAEQVPDPFLGFLSGDAEGNRAVHGHDSGDAVGVLVGPVHREGSAVGPPDEDRRLVHAPGLKHRADVADTRLE